MNERTEGIALINGKISRISEAKVPIMDRGFLFGHAVFETILVHHGKIIALEKHLQRLEHSCRRSFIKPPEIDLLKENLQLALRENTSLTQNISPKTIFRIIVTGGSNLDLPIAKSDGNLPDPNIIIICRNITGPSKEQYLYGVKLKTLLDLRPKELVDIKSCNYLFNIMAIEEAKTSHFEDALFYDKSGILTECTTANFIWFDENYNIFSAPFENNCLAGTTLTLLVEAIEQSAFKFQWKALKKSNLQNVFGCAILSSTRLLLPIQKIDDFEFQNAKHQDFFKTLNTLLLSKLHQ